MRTLVASPCMDTVHTAFAVSLLRLNKPAGTEVAVSSSSLVYEARHALARKAIEEGFDRILWIDSDMRFGADLLTWLGADLDQGPEMVSALFFSRKYPVHPCVYQVCRDMPGPDGSMIPTATPVSEIPEEEGLFEIEGCGFGAVMMTTDLIKRVGRLPFYPLDGYGEDLSFCRRAREAGAKIYCDSRIRVDHVGLSLYNASAWHGGKG